MSKSPNDFKKDATAIVEFVMCLMYGSIPSTAARQLTREALTDMVALHLLKAYTDGAQVCKEIMINSVAKVMSDITIKSQ